MEEKVLVVDDESVSREKLSYMLNKASYKVIRATDGQDALEKLDNYDNIRLIVTDLCMPGIDGLDFMARLRKKGWKQPVIGITTTFKIEEEEFIKDYGFDQCFNKPIDAKKFLKTVDKLIAGSDAPRLTFSN